MLITSQLIPIELTQRELPHQTSSHLPQYDSAFLKSFPSVFYWFPEANPFFFYRQKQKYIRKGHQEENPKAYREYTKGPLRQTQGKRKNKPDPYLAPSQSRKLGKVRGPSFTIYFVHTQRLQTKEFFNL